MDDLWNECPPLTPTARPTQTIIGIYAILYRHPSLGPAIYVGHSRSILNRLYGHSYDPANKGRGGYHYTIANATSERDTKRILLTELPDDTNVLYLCEQLFVMLLKTYATPLLHKVDDPIVISRNYVEVASCDFFTRLAKDVHQETGWQGCQVEGYNWNSPISEKASGERTIWTKITKPNEVEIYRRSSLPVHEDKGSLKVSCFGTAINLQSGFPDLQKGVLVNIVCEIRIDGQPHSIPYARMPTIGPYEDWDKVNSLGIRAEWRTADNKWHAIYCQASKVGHHAGGFGPRAYVITMGIINHLQGVRYQTPEPWRTQMTPARVKEIGFDNLIQQITIRDITGHRTILTPALKTEQRLKQEMMAVGLIVRQIPQDPSWAQVPDKKRKSCDLCYNVRLP